MGAGGVPKRTDREASFPEHEATAAAFVRHIAAKYGDAEAAVRGDERATYADLERRSAEVAKALLASGVGKGTKVGLLFPNSPEWLVQWLGITRIGAVAVLLNTFSKPRELGWMLRFGDVAQLHMVDGYLNHDYVERLEACVDGLARHRAGSGLLSVSHPFLREVRVWGGSTPAWASDGPRWVEEASSTISDEVLVAAEEQVTPADPMMIIFSSGSTAEPKAAVHTQGGGIRHPHNLLQFRSMGRDDVVYCPMPLFWVGGLSWTAVGVLHAGARLLFDTRFDPGPTLELLERERVTQISAWPDLAKSLVEHPSFPERKLSIRSGTMAELLPEELRPRNPELLCGSLGMTETLGPHMIEFMPTELPPEKKGAFGRGAPGVEHKIVDPATGETLGPRQEGEICVRGYSLMLGLHRKERSEVFDTDGWYHTGDGGWYDEDGYIYFTGRLGDMIKTAGTNVAPREVELVAAAVFPEIMHVAVVGIPHPDHGQHVAMAVVPRHGHQVDPDQVKARLKEELSSYKVPRHVAVLAEDELPWLDSQKVDRRRVSELLAQRFPA